MTVDSATTATGVTPRRTCGTQEVHQRLLRAVPEYVERRAAIESSIWAYANAFEAFDEARAGVIVIPVVMHVVWHTDGDNISDEQVKSQIDVLNADYRKANADIEATPEVFKSLCADAQVEFALATVDPTGAPTDGIVRVQTEVESFGTDDAVKATATGGSDAWPADSYLNIWACNLGGGLLGYAQFPGGPAETDGVVILSSAIGTTGSVAAPFNLGRTTTHEVGHWLNLRHIWGDDGDGCGGSDLVADTPNCAGPNYGAPDFPHVTCQNGPNGDLFMNYMDYVDDAVMVMFTTEQVARMRAAIDLSRSTIGATKPATDPPPADGTETT